MVLTYSDWRTVTYSIHVMLCHFEVFTYRDGESVLRCVFTFSVVDTV